MKMLKAIILYMILASPLLSQDNTESDGGSTLFKSKTSVKNALELRDPFKRKMNKTKGGQSRSQNKNNDNGIYTNQVDRIEDKPIENIRIVGIMIGKERRAMAKISQGNTLGRDVYFIKEGMKIGANGAEVKAILPGGIVLVEKIRNVYDQDEYLETVIPVSNE